MSRPRQRFSQQNESLAAEGHPTGEEIGIRAYEVYVERGGAHGQDMDDWLQSEGELLEKYETWDEYERWASRLTRVDLSRALQVDP
jgi:hypothetical protein